MCSADSTTKTPIWIISKISKPTWNASSEHPTRNPSDRPTRRRCRGTSPAQMPGKPMGTTESLTTLRSACHHTGDPLQCLQRHTSSASLSIHLKNLQRCNDQEQCVPPKLPPISLLPMLGKLCERSVLDRLNIAVLQKNVVPDV